MKQRIILGVLVFVASYVWEVSGDTCVPPPAPKVQKSDGVRIFEFVNLLESERSFGDLARLSYYTVVEVYMDRCAICRRLESSYLALLE